MYNELLWTLGSTYDTSRHTVDKNKNIVYLDGTEIKKFIINLDFNCPGSMYLLNINQNNNGDIETLPSGVRVYSCQIYNNGTLIRNYIPCY